ncbi:MAG: putative mannose-phosphate guanylyltransferase [Frankiales bacterium]|nr:putative mannose-phosphate guanylyltransferase [Frankiales bacterium]
MRHALILAGGSGTRLWPYSTARLPKQLVPLLQGRSLLDVAVERASSCVPADRVWLGAGEQLRAAVSQVPGLRADRLVVEPSARDTLPAVALGCAVIAACDPEAVVAVLTADHLIEPLESFSQTLDAAFALAEQRDDALVTFGVVPDAPATGFGYLELGAPLGAGRVVTRFQEKPTLSRAAEFLAAGPDRYLWNSGMFVWQAQTLLRAVDEFSPHAGLVLRAMGQAYGTPRWEPLSRDAWPTVARLSVDYGVMEPASTSADFTVAALPLAARWLDVGSWPAYGDAVGRDEDGNAVGAAKAVLHASRGNVVASSDPDHLVTLVGCEGLVVVHTPAATLVMPANEAQRVKELHALVAQQHPGLA